MKNSLKKSLNKIYAFLFPNPCVVCGKTAGINKFVCNKCKGKLVLWDKYSVCRTCSEPMSNYLSYCSKCLVEKPQYDQLITCVKYSGDVKRMILWYKFYDRPDFCDSFALMIYNRLIESHCTDVDVIIPIPLSKKRLSDRGYNQSELIAQRLSELLNIPCETDVLLKIKDTKTQSTLPKNKRESNIHGAFKLYNKDKIYNKSILIVDDVVTTGATMREAARLISKSAYKINCCAIAKNVFNKSKNKSG